MIYEFECPVCKERKEVWAKLRDCDELKAVTVCDNEGCKNFGKPVNRVLSAHPKHSSWENW